MKTINELLPQPLGSLEASEPLCNILTEDEQKQAIDWAVKTEKERYAHSMADKGMHPQTIQQRIAERDWTQHIDTEKVLQAANQRKHWAEEEAREREEKRQRQADALQAIINRCNANHFFKLIKRYYIQHYGEFIHNEMNEHYIRTICFYISGDERFETELNYSFKKGLLIVGDAGLGKTKTIEAIKDNELRPISIYSMIDISERVRESGSAAINMNKFVLLDDVGSEQETVNHYGTKINWFKDFIETYYLHNKVYNRLLITTNCDGDELERKYGYRVRSRMREMFNQISITGKDLRK